MHKAEDPLSNAGNDYLPGPMAEEDDPMLGSNGLDMTISSADDILGLGDSEMPAESNTDSQMLAGNREAPAPGPEGPGQPCAHGTLDPSDAPSVSGAPGVVEDGP